MSSGTGKTVKIVEIVQMSPGEHFIVRRRGSLSILPQPTTKECAEAVANRIKRSYKLLHIDCEIVYLAPWAENGVITGAKSATA